MTKANVAENPQEQLMNQLAENFGLKAKGQSLGEAAYSLASQKIASKYSHNVETFGRRLASGTSLDKHSKRVGKLFSAAWLTLVPMGMTAYNSSKNIRQAMGNYLNLNNEFHRSLSASGSHNMWIFSNPSSRPEVVVNEARLLGRKAKNDTKTMIVSMLLDIPNVLATRLQSLIDELGRSKKGNRNKKKTSAIGKMADEQQKVAADSINKKIDNWLDSQAVDGEGKNRTYDGMLNSALEMFNDGDGLESLNDKKGRYKALRNIKSKILGPFVTIGASTLKPTLTNAFGVRSEAAFKKPTAGKMIKDLQNHMKKNPTPVSLSLSGCSKKECSLEEYIMDIFAQHQKDCGRGEIPKRMQSNLARAAGQIAAAMTDPQRQLHPEALVLLVDKKHGITSFNKGEVTGIEHGDKLDDYLAKMLQKPVMSSRKKISAQKRYDTYESTREQFADSWDNLTDDEKFLWSCIVPREILDDIGVSKQEQQQLINQDNDLWEETLEEAFKAISKLSSQDLKEEGLSDTQVVQVREAISGMRKKNAHYLQKNRQEMTELVADVATMVDSQRPDFIKDILGRARKRRDHNDILREKDNEKPLAEQVLASRKDTSENSRH